MVIRRRGVSRLILRSLDSLFRRRAGRGASRQTVPFRSDSACRFPRAVLSLRGNLDEQSAGCRGNGGFWGWAYKRVRPFVLTDAFFLPFFDRVFTVFLTVAHEKRFIMPLIKNFVQLVESKKGL